jgi:outer membrane lipoprotein carrier protein
MNALFFLMLAATATPAPSPSPAASPKPAASPRADDSAKWAAKVQKAYVGVRDYQADFSQQTSLKGAGTEAPKSTGKVWIAKPGKMRWEFDSPEKKTIVSDGKTMWMYDAEENQVIVNEHLDQTTSLTALNFLEGLGDLTKEFTVTMTDAPADAADPKAIFLALVPKDDSDVQLSRIVLELDKKTALAGEVYLDDALGNRTKVTFSGAKVNKGMKAETFTFPIPKGAEVINPAILEKK